MNHSISIVEVIQLMLAPGLMISACGLLLLGMNNKYSLVVNRIRLLNEEKRRITQRSAGKDFSYEDTVRLESISLQMRQLEFRVRLVKNAVLFYTFAVALFVLTSLSIGSQFISEYLNLNYVTTVLFLIGMIFVLVGVVFAAYETIKGYQIVKLEVKAEE